MKKERKAQIATLLILAAVLGFVAVRKLKLAPAPKAAAGSTPQDAIYSMLDAAREGDVRKYVSCYTGQMLASLEQAVAEKSEREFSRYLKESNAPIKGIAITEPQTLTDREVKVRVEYIYQDRNEAQTMYVEKQGSAWKIARVDSTERIKTLIPYGTPVQ